MPQTVILAGGLGSRLSEETYNKPKPMVEIGKIPIISHIMNIYIKHNYNDFIIAAGYKSIEIKRYFWNHDLENFNIEINQKLKKKIKKKSNNGDYSIKVIDTGKQNQTGSRLYQLRNHIKDDIFFMTYGDGLCDVNLNSLLSFHKKNKNIVTMTVVHPPARFGYLDIRNGKVKKFREKGFLVDSWINGGFFVLDKKVFNYLSKNKNCVFEKHGLENIASDGKLGAYKHFGNWQCMDTKRDKENLEELFRKKKAFWI